MEFVIVILIMALTFGACFLVDKGFTKLFRGQAEHRSGKAVRLNKRFATIGIILVILGLAAFFMGFNSQKILLFGGPVVLMMGITLIVYYMAFGVFYDVDSFILTTFGKKSTTYRYADIKEQRLYVIQGGSMVVELHLADGRVASLQSTMPGVLDFLDHAFAAWCRQTGRDSATCEFHDPARFMWFPGVEED